PGDVADHRRQLLVAVVKLAADHRTSGLRRENLAEALDRTQHALLRQPRPLAAHDEMVDTEKLAIPCDLLLHRHLVTDDEPVARKILKRTLRAAVLQTP